MSGLLLQKYLYKIDLKQIETNKKLQIYLLLIRTIVIIIYISMIMTIRVLRQTDIFSLCKCFFCFYEYYK